LNLRKTSLGTFSCVEVTLVSKFHPIWCLIAQELKLRRDFLTGLDIYPPFLLYTAETGHIWFKIDHVRQTVFSPTLVHCFGYILLIGCPIDLILFFCCVRNFEGIISTLLVGVFITFLKGFGLGVLNLGHRSVLAKEFDSTLIHPPTPVTSPGPSIGIRAGYVTSCP
jgi:hypothetical protein